MGSNEDHWFGLKDKKKKETYDQVCFSVNVLLLLAEQHCILELVPEYVRQTKGFTIMEMCVGRD